MKHTTFLSAAALSLLATPALAHPGHFEVNSAMAGILHPLVGLDHLLAMVAVGILATQGKTKTALMLPLLFVAVMVGGGALALANVSLPFVELGILGSVVVLGTVIAVGRHLPVIASGAMIAFFALFHGFAHGMEIPAGAHALNYLGGFALSTLALHGAGLIIGFSAARYTAQITSPALRYIGAAIAFAGLGLATV